MTEASTHLITVNEGRTLVYIFPAVFFGLGAVIGFVFFVPLAILLTGMVILLSLVETGLDYNPSTQQYRRYKSLFGKKWGSWKQLVSPEKFELRISAERAYNRSPFANVASASWYGQSGEIARSVTYDLTYGSSSQKDAIIYEFQDYKIAKQFVKQLEGLNTQPVINHIAIKLQANMEKRMQRMSR